MTQKFDLKLLPKNLNHIAFRLLQNGDNRTSRCVLANSPHFSAGEEPEYEVRAAC